jgi:AcrR family transcriptional regulator
MARKATETAPKAAFRRRLIVAFEQSIREKGLEATGIGDIVQKAGTSNRTFYECFANKEECLAELIEKWGEEILGAVRAAVDPASPWRVQVDQTVDAYLGALAADPVLTVTASRDMAMLGRRGVALQEQDIDRYVGLVMELSASPGFQAGGVAAVDRPTALMLIGGVAEVVDRAARQGRSPLTLAPTIKRVLELVLQPAR